MSTTKRRAVGAATNLHWSQAQKQEALTTYLTFGTIRATSAVLKIPEPTLMSWKRQEWWKDQEKELRASENIILSNKLKKIVDKSLDVLSDRLDKGDYIYNQKTGEMVRKPVGARDLGTIATSMIDKQQKIRTEEFSVVVQENIQDKLAKLAADFARVAERLESKPQINVVDVIYQNESTTTDTAGDSDEGEIDNAVYEEWEEGLQEGERAVQLSSGTEGSSQ